MFKSIKSKLLVNIILAIVIINGAFGVFIAISLDKTLKEDIIDEMNKFKSISLYTIKQNEVIEEPLWKTLDSIKSISNSYVSIADEKRNIIQFTGERLNDEEIEKIINESDNKKSIIKFNNYEGKYCITYNYPIYLENKFYGNLVIQKDYIEKYNSKFKTLLFIIIGQSLSTVVILIIISIIVKKVTDPIKVLSNSMKSFSEFNEIDDVLIWSSDELSELAETYNEMKNKIKNQMNTIVEEKEKVERLQKSSREFFNNATHELKTPITAISLYAQILKDIDIETLEEDFINRASNRIVLESEKMKILVEKILEVSRGDVNLSKSKSKFSLTELIEEILGDFEVRISNKGLTINKNLQQVLIESVLEDIEQIITNLLDNSIKYNKDNKFNLNLYENEENIVFTISNKCVSFPDDIKDKLLEPFIKYNTYEDISKEVSSSGLGLYLCKELSRENNGELSYNFESNEIIFILKIKKCS